MPRRPLPRLAPAAALLPALLAAPALAQDYPPATDRDYAIDLHQGSVIGSARTIGMGGTGVATAVGSAGSLFNPAAAAVRPENSSGAWDWDWHFDYLSAAAGSDYDNNGQPQEVEVGLFRAPLLTGGLVGQYRSWGLGVNLVYLQHEIRQSDALAVLTTVAVGRLTLARSFLGDALTAGISFRSGTFGFNQVAIDGDGDETSTSLFSIGGTALEGGALWRPRGGDLRVGVSGSLPVNGDKVEGGKCDPLDCAAPAPGQGYVLPERAVLPWQVSAGVAWRRGPTAWNRPVRGDWRDERYLLVAADLVVTGRVADGTGVEAFAARQLQRSGRDVGVSPRAGVEYEWMPGRLRVRGGSYWEPSRFRDEEGDAIPGRLHATFGLDVRVWSFCLWRERYRLRLSLTSDAARRYGNGGISIGLWH